MKNIVALTPTVLNKMALVDITQGIRAQDCESDQCPSFSTNLTGFRVGWKRWSTKPTENGWFLIEHVPKKKNLPNQPNPVGPNRTQPKSDYYTTMNEIYHIRFQKRTEMGRRNNKMHFHL